MSITVAKINNAIAEYDLEIIRGEGYQYFLDTNTGYQIGESVYVCWLKDLSLKRWKQKAKYARENPEF